MVAGLLAPAARRSGSPPSAARGSRRRARSSSTTAPALSVVGLGEVAEEPLASSAPSSTETVRWIGEHRPRAVCFVDYSGVNLRIAEALRLRGISAKGGGAVRHALLHQPADLGLARRPPLRHGAQPGRPRRHLSLRGRVLRGHGPARGVRRAIPSWRRTTRPRSAYDPAGPVLLLPGSRVKAVARIFPALLAGYREFAPGNRSGAAVVLYPSAESAAAARGRRIPAGRPPPADGNARRRERGADQQRDDVDALRPGGHPGRHRLPDRSLHLL